MDRSIILTRLNLGQALNNSETSIVLRDVLDRLAKVEKSLEVLMNVYNNAVRKQRPNKGTSEAVSTKAEVSTD